MVYSKTNSRPGMSKDQALSLAAKALLASAQRDAASGNGMDLAFITNETGFTQLSEEEVGDSPLDYLITFPT